MKKLTLAVALLAALSAAHAQDMSSSQYGEPAAVLPPSAVANGAPGAMAPAPAPVKPLRFLLGAGLTSGGDKLATAEYENGTEQDIRAGSFFALLAGVDYRVNSAFSLQATVGFHVDDTTASNGSITFKRFPVELLAYYHPNAKMRFGGGARYVGSPKLSLSGAAGSGHVNFDNTMGAIVEFEYFYTPKLGLKVRYVAEKYDTEGLEKKIDGNHVGFFANYYF